MVAPPDSHIAVLKTDGKPVGAGFHVGSKRIVTCTHVFADAVGCPRAQTNIPDRPVFIRARQSGKVVEATVVAWYPMPNDYAKGVDPFADIAILHAPDLPDDTPAAQLATSLDDNDQFEFRSTGFSNGQDLGETATGTIVLGSLNYRKWITLNSDTRKSLQIGPGFSGAPVELTKSPKIAGMIVADDWGRTGDDVAVAYMIPSAVLISALDALDPSSTDNLNIPDVVGNEGTLFALPCGGGIERPTLPVELGWQIGVTRDTTVAVIENAEFAQVRTHLERVEKICAEALDAKWLISRRWHFTDLADMNGDYRAWAINIPDRFNRDDATKTIARLVITLNERYQGGFAVVMVMQRPDELLPALRKNLDPMWVDHYHCIGAYLPLVPGEPFPVLQGDWPNDVRKLSILAARLRGVEIPWAAGRPGITSFRQAGPVALVDQIEHALNEGRVLPQAVIEFLVICLSEWPAIGEALISEAVRRGSRTAQLALAVATDLAWPMGGWLAEHKGEIPDEWLFRNGGHRSVLSAIRIGICRLECEAKPVEASWREMADCALLPVEGVESVEYKYFSGQYLSDFKSLAKIAELGQREPSYWWFAALQPVTTAGLRTLAGLGWLDRAVMGLLTDEERKRLRQDQWRRNQVRARQRRQTEMCD